jgi:MSHA biogenesis protein MshJ
MIERLASVRDWLEARNSRELIVLAAAACAGIVLLVEALAWAPARKRLHDAEAQVASFESQRSVLQGELDTLDQQEALDPDAAVRRQLDAFEGQVGTIDQKLQGQALQLIAPEQARSVLQALIANVRGLRMVGLKTEPARPLVETQGLDLPVLYRHGLVIDLEGDYLALIGYLQALEQLPWRLYWYGVEVTADKPGARRFRLRLYTVSLRKEWIRV